MPRATPEPAIRISVRSVPISSIRTDGKTQHRSEMNPEVVAEYAGLMRGGVVFPPVRVWWDGNAYWLADGFHRIAAATRAGFSEIAAEVNSGSLNDAQWDSYSANTSHGLRWTRGETTRVVQLALDHPNATRLSNVEIAKHLHLSEITVRRWRKRLSSTGDEDRLRVVTRGTTTYALATGNIGRTSTYRRTKCRDDLRMELALMKELSSQHAKRIFIIIGNWALGSSTPSECVDAIERVIKDT
jgi:hypothetical protein